MNKNIERDLVNFLYFELNKENFSGIYNLTSPKVLTYLETVKNKVKTDNRINNLEWLSKKDNIRHAFANGLQVKREERKSTKISNADMIALYNDGHSGNFTISQLANKYKLTKGYIKELSRGLYNKELKLIPFNQALKK